MPLDEDQIRAEVAAKKSARLAVLSQRFRDEELSFDDLLIEVYESGYQHALEVLSDIADIYFVPEPTEVIQHEHRHDEEGSNGLDHEGAPEER